MQDLAQADNARSEDGWVFTWKKKNTSEGEKKKKIMKNEWPKKWKIEKWLVYRQKIAFLGWSP